MEYEERQAKIHQVILEHVPKEAEITRVEFEGPKLAIYTKRPEVLIDQSHIVSQIVSLLRKRITIRSDPSVRLNEKEAEQIIRKTVSPEADITNILFDPTLGEVIVEARKPGLVIRRNGVMLQEITKLTKWRPNVLRTPPIPSKIIAHIRHYSYSEVKERERILRAVGERIFRPKIFRTQEVILTPLGAFQHVGRSACLIRTRESSVLIDCGINPSTSNPADLYPRLDSNEFDLSELDAIVISHSHLDHCGLLPLLFKYGYDGPVYCAEPTLSLMILLQLDYLDVAAREGNYAPYDQKDVRQVVLHTIPLKYGVVTDIAPDLRLTLHNGGHILGSAILHIHVGEGLHNIVYTGDFKFMHTSLLEAATATFPRVETLIMESTYGAPDDVMPSRAEMEQHIVQIIRDTFSKGGKVLIPVLAVGRAQEVMLVLNEAMHRGQIMEAPIYLDGMINEVTAIHTAYPEYLSRDLQSKILYEDVNPFQSDYFVPVKHPEARNEIFDGPPCIILATSGMLEGGPVIEYFRHLAHDERNAVVLVSYQFEGTIGRRLQQGAKEISMMMPEGKMEVINVKCRVESVEGFSGHSDRNQLLAFVRNITPKPQRIIVMHGERSKCLNLASTLRKIFGVNAEAPGILQTTCLYGE